MHTAIKQQNMVFLWRNYVHYKTTILCHTKNDSNYIYLAVFPETIKVNYLQQAACQSDVSNKWHLF